ncbi:hypothetical protein [Bacillus sp. AK128]
MRGLLISIAIILQFVLVSSQAFAADFTNSQLFKVTILQNNEETEFEFENPSHYEWEKGSTVVKGKEAQKVVTDIFNELSLTKQTKVNEIKVNLEQYGFTEVDHFVVRWIDQDGKLYTWHWEKE